MKQNLSTRGQGRAGSGLAKVLMTLAIMLFVATGAWAQEPATTYSVKMKDGTVDAKNWTITSGEKSAKGDAADGLTGLSEGDQVTLTYTGRLKVKGVKATSDAAPAAPAGKTVDLSTLTADYEAQNGDVLTNATTTYKVTIAAGATVTLDGVDISSGDYYCIKCAGDATIILKDGSTNTLASSSDSYPALWAGDANTTLTIQGSTGVLNVTSGVYCAGIGGGYSNTNNTCGNIRIEGGVITAQGGGGGAGIGTDAGPATCGDIIITGGTITAKGGSNAAGIGTGDVNGSKVVCGDITIANTVTKVTATKGANAPYSIGKGSGDNATCGTVTIGGNTGAISESPYTYDPSAPAAPALNITSPSVGQVIGSDGKNYAYGSLPTGVTAVAMIAKVSGTSGLAIALADEEGTMNWDTAVTTAAAHTPTFTGGTWRLPTQNEWKQMFASFGGNNASCSGLNTAIGNAGGTALVMYNNYCSSTESGSNVYYAIFSGSGVDWQNGSKTLPFKVRPCLAF